MTMPEAAIYKYCQPEFGKYEIRISKNPIVPSPAFQPRFPENTDELHFG
jgi:hypothetical protein